MIPPPVGPALMALFLTMGVSGAWVKMSEKAEWPTLTAAQKLAVGVTIFLCLMLAPGGAIGMIGILISL